MNATPIACRWTGESFIPWQLQLARKHYEPGSTYPLVVNDERSTASHNEYFAALDSRWETLPQELEAEYPSRESMRHKVLIKCGYCNERDFILPTDSVATMFAAALIEADDQCYTIIEVRGRVVRRYRAMSQSYRAMGKAQFQESKSKVLDYIDSELLGISPPAESARR